MGLKVVWRQSGLAGKLSLEESRGGSGVGGRVGETEVAQVGSLLRRLVPLAMLVAMIGIVGGVKPLFFSVYSLQTQLSAAAPLLLLALGEAGVILLGGIDLSNATVAALATVLLAEWLGHGPGAGIVAAVVLMTTCMGAINGVVAVWGQVPSFIVTLGAMGLWAGVALVASNDSTISVNDPQAINWFGGMSAGVPNAFLVGLVAVAVAAFVLRKVPGARLGMYAIGAAESAARMSGVRVGVVRVAAFAGAGLFAGLAAVVLAAQDLSGDPTAASSLLLPCIAAVVVGGNAITGGVGGAWRVLVGALIITVLDNGIAIVGVNPLAEQIVYGGVLLVAAGVTVDRSRVRFVK